MRHRITNAILITSVIAGFGALPAVSAAKHGADDNKPAKVDDHGGKSRGADDAPGDDRGGRR